MSKYSAIVQAAATRKILEDKLKRRVSPSSIGETLGDLQSLVRKVDTVQSSLGSITNALQILGSQVNLFQNIADGLQESLEELEDAVDNIITSTMTKHSYTLQPSGPGIISYEDDGECVICVVENPLQSKDIIVQVVDTSSSDEIVTISTEISENNVKLKLALCDEQGQYRVTLLG